MRGLIFTALLLVGGCGYLSNERYTLLGCNPDARVCRVFDTYTGEVEVRPLPITPAERGQQEVKR